MEKQRVAMLDNVRAVLILLVVLGHLLERIGFFGSQTLYKLIYSFHMPAFAFVSGLFFVKNKSGVWKKMLLPYLIFQTLYLAQEAWADGVALSLQFTKPVWILWYLLALLLWYMIADLIDLEGRKGRFALAVSICVALLAGFDSSIGSRLALSRTLCFFPFFLAGAYIRADGFASFQQFFCRKRRWKESCLLLLPALLSLFLLLLFRERCQASWFYGSEAYGEGYTLCFRLWQYLAAASAILALCTLIPKGSLPLLSRIGRNTMPVYLLHGLLLRAGDASNIYIYIYYTKYRGRASARCCC